MTLLPKSCKTGIIEKREANQEKWVVVPLLDNSLHRGATDSPTVVTNIGHTETTMRFRAFFRKHTVPLCRKPKEDENRAA